MKRVGVVGGGIMGCGIAEVAARAGVDVVVCELDDTRVEASRARLTASLDRRVQRGVATVTDAEAVLANVRFATTLHELADRELVIEAVVEDRAEKTRILSALDEILDEADAIVASNTSTFPITSLAAATKRPERVIGLHFFNPVPVLPLVEIIPGLLTSETTVERVEVFARDMLGKKPIRCQDRVGFVVNRLLVPFLLAAVEMVDQGVAAAEDIDAAMVDGCNHPLGPLALSDLIGLDTLLAVAETLHDECPNPAFAAPSTLRRLVEAGRLGRKSGHGFYSYA